MLYAADTLRGRLCANQVGVYAPLDGDKRLDGCQLFLCYGCVLELKITAPPSIELVSSNHFSMR